MQRTPPAPLVGVKAPHVLHDPALLAAEAAPAKHPQPMSAASSEGVVPLAGGGVGAGVDPKRAS